MKFGFLIPIVSGIPDSLSCLPDSKAQDSGCHKQRFPAVSGVRIPFMGREQAMLVGPPGGGGALKESLGRAVTSHLGFGFVKGTAWHHHLTNVEKTCSRCHSQ